MKERKGMAMIHRKTRIKIPGIRGKAAWGMAIALAVLPGLSPIRAFAADSSVVERVSVTFSTTYGDAEEIPEPAISVSGSGIETW